MNLLIITRIDITKYFVNRLLLLFMTASHRPATTALKHSVEML